MTIKACRDEIRYIFIWNFHHLYTIFKDISKTFILEYVYILKDSQISWSEIVFEANF